MAEKKSYKRYKDYKALIGIAEACLEVKGKGTKRVTKAKADEMFDAIEKDGKYSDAEKAAVAFIRENYIFTDAGKSLLGTSLRDWALERGRATQAAAREEEAKKTAAEAKKAAKATKAKAVAEAKETKAAEEKSGEVATSKIGDAVLDRKLVRLALKFVEANLTKARETVGEEDYKSGSVGGRKSITKDDVKALVDYVYEDGVYSDIEKTTMSWIRKNIGMTKGARAEWKKQVAAAKKAK